MTPKKDKKTQGQASPHIDGGRASRQQTSLHSGPNPPDWRDRTQLPDASNVGLRYQKKPKAMHDYRQDE